MEQKAAELLVKLFIEAEKQGALDRLRDRFRKKHTLLVLGSTGVGKTNFLSSLKEALPVAIDLMHRTEFARKHSLKIENEPFIFIDTPGQIGHRERRLAAIREAMRSKPGIVNVVCYGYHEYRTDPSEAVDEQGMVRPEYLEAHRHREIEQLSEWTELLGDPETTSFLITVVTKADLWRDGWHRVVKHYQHDAYFENLGAAQSLRPVVLPYCSVFHKFYGVAPLSGKVDDHDRARMRGHLIEQLLTAVGGADDG